MLSAHFSIQLTVNESTGSYYSRPYADARIEFAIPIDFISAKPLAELLMEQVQVLAKAFPSVKAEYEKEVRADEALKAKEKAEEDASKDEEIQGR